MKSKRHVRRPLILAGVIGVVAAVLYTSGAFTTWSHRVTDRFFLDRPADPSIVLVAIDDTSLSQIGRWPWDRKIHGEIIDALSAAGVRAIGYDVNFPEPSDSLNDAALEGSLRKAGNVVLPIELTIHQERKTLMFDRETVIAPLPALSTAAKATGHTNTPPDADGVVRRIPLFVTAPDTTLVTAFALQVLKIADPSYPASAIPLDALSRAMVNFNGPPKKNFDTISAVDLLRGTVRPETLKDKIVFVGSTAADLHDDQLVPTSRGVPMPGVELHASVYDTLMTQRWLQAVPAGIQALLLVLLSLIVGLLLSVVRSRYSIPMLLVLWAGIVVGSFILFDHGWIIDLFWVTLTLALVSAAVILERRVTADRERHELRSAFSRYVSGSVVEAILRDPQKLKLGGEKRRMTVLFSDVRGFTSIAETMSAEQLVDVMNTYLTRMTEMVFQQEGVLDKYIGDAVMAFWNAPLDQADHALRAIKTALSMQRALEEMNRADAFSNGLALKIGIGINTGDMIVGNMGSEVRFDYTVIGDNVNLASRMEGITKEYGVGILISEATQQDAGERIVARRIDKVAVKGKKEPIVLYEVLALVEEATPEQRRLAEQFEAGLEAYFSKQFQDAISRGEVILQTYPDDGPSKTLIQRSRQFLIDPPPADWDGTWVFTKK